MRRLFEGSTLGLLLFLTTSIGTNAQTLKPMDFARGMKIQPAGTTPVQTFVLQPEVYRIVRSTSLDDIRVFNAGGEEVPYTINSGGNVHDEVVQTVSLPVFPVRGGALENRNDFSILVERRPNGMVVGVDERRLPGRPNPVTSYLLDASQIKKPIRHLSFTWEDESVEFVTDVVTESSDDLTHWSVWGNPVTLAGLQYDQDTLRQAEMDLPPRQARYIRLSWPSGGSLPILGHVEARIVEPREPERAWISIRPETIKPLVIQYNTGGHFPVDRLRLQQLQVNTLARVTVYSSNSTDGPWIRRAGDMVYQIRLNERDLKSIPLAFPSCTDSLWRVEVDASGGGIGAKAPVLEIGYVPDRVTFLMRGDLPFVLAFGSQAAGSSNALEADLNQLITAGGVQQVPVEYATLGPAYDLGGLNQLTPSTTIPWQRVALWTVLVLGVLVLAWMAVRLIRQMDRQGNPENPV